MTKPTGNPRGRPQGSTNHWSKISRDLAATYLDSSIKQAAILAGVEKVELLHRRGKLKGTPVMEQMFNDDGSPKLDKKRQPIFAPVMVFAPANSETVQLGAIQFLTERAAGKATQPLANDSENPLTDVKPNGKVIFGVMPGVDVPEGIVLGPPDKDGMRLVEPPKKTA